MDFISRKAPAYKGMNVSRAATQPVATSGLSGLLGSLLGRATPVYKTVHGRGAQPVSSGLLAMFAVTPSYKTAQAAAMQMPVEVVTLEIDEVDDAGVVGTVDEYEPPLTLPPDEIVLL
jgi:hypothetical protein